MLGLYNFFQNLHSPKRKRIYMYKTQLHTIYTKRTHARGKNAHAREFTINGHRGRWAAHLLTAITHSFA